MKDSRSKEAQIEMLLNAIVNQEFGNSFLHNVRMILC